MGSEERILVVLEKIAAAMESNARSQAQAMEYLLKFGKYFDKLEPVMDKIVDSVARDLDSR